MSPRFERENFLGIVMLKEWWADPRTGAHYRAITGRVSILTDEEIVGFKVNSQDSRWVARVVGPSGEAHVILGCQVRGVIAHVPDTAVGPLHSDVLVVP